MAANLARVRSGSHRRLRGGVWWYRRDVPKDARPAFEWPSAKRGAVCRVTAVWESLHTTDESEAKRLEKIKDVEFERRLREARDSLDPEKRRAHAVADYMEQVPQGIAVLDIRRGGTGVAAHDESDSINAALRERWHEQSRIADLAREIAAMLPGLPSARWERCQSDVLSIVRHYAAPAATVPTITAPEVCLWGTIFEQWQAGMKPGSKTVYSWKRIIRKLVSHLAQKREITVDEAMAWNAASLTEDELIAWKNALVKQIGPTTIKNHLTILRTLYNYAADNRLLLARVAKGVKRVKHKAKKKPGTGRIGYTDDDARAILLAARQETDPVKRWSPWLAAALGSRIDEICGAMVPDIEVDHDGIAWFNIRLDYRETDPDQDPEIKSDNAERKLPIPPSVWRGEGFGDYVGGLPKDSPLFPNLTADRFGRRGGNGSKRVQRWVRNKVGIKDKRKAPSHSWRHRFRSILRNPTYGIGEDVADYMAGHSGDGGEGRSYGEYRDAMIVAIKRLPPPLPLERQLTA